MQSDIPFCNSARAKCLSSRNVWHAFRVLEFLSQEKSGAVLMESTREKIRQINVNTYCFTRTLEIFHEM